MRGKGRKHGWQRPRHFDDENGCWIVRNPANPPRSSGAAREHVTHSLPLCKARSKGKGNRKAFDRDVASDYRLYDWAPFGDEGSQTWQGDIASKVSLSDVTQERRIHRMNKDLSFEEAMGIATSLSLVTAIEEDEKRRGLNHLMHQQVFSSDFSCNGFGEGSSSSSYPPLYPIYAPGILMPNPPLTVLPIRSPFMPPPILPEQSIDDEDMILPINLDDIFDESESSHPPVVQEDDQIEETSSDAAAEDDQTEGSGSVWSWESCEEDDGEEELVENGEFVNVLKGPDGWSVISVY